METRSLLNDLTGDGNTLTGYAAVFDSPTTIREGGRVFSEVIRRGAFRNAINSGGDVVSFFNHDPNRLLGRTSSGTLKIWEDDRGLRFEVQLPQHAQDVREMLQRGDLKGASFAFRPRSKDGEKWTGNTRELLDLYLAELGPVVQPAYPSTSVGLRSQSEIDAARNARQRLIDLLKI